MASVIYVDTHVVVWLFAGMVRPFPPGAARRLESNQLLISPMVSLELQYLHEIGRVNQPSAHVVQDLANRVGLAVADTPFQKVISVAAQQQWTRDPFDRVITAQAMADGVALLTRDETIRAHCPLAVWD
ncbi:MAG: PIN domain-containing protein [Myxococcota bacterium]